MTQPQYIPHLGVGLRLGTGWRLGYGVSDPWSPCAPDPDNPTRFTVEQYNDTTPIFIGETDRIYQITDAGVVTRVFDPAGSIPDEIFYLQAPIGQWWKVTANGRTGVETAVPSSKGAPIGKQIASPDGRLWYIMILNDGSRFVMPDSQWFSEGSASLIFIDNTGLLHMRYNPDGTVPNEVFSTQSPNGHWWRVTVSGHDGSLAVASTTGQTNPIGKELSSPDGRLWKLGVDDSGSLTISPIEQPYTQEPNC